MKVKDIEKIVLDKVSIYEEINVNEYETLYEGDIEDVPKDLADRYLRGIGGKSKGVLDVWVR